MQHHLPDPEMAPDQRLQVNPARFHVAPCRTGVQVHPVFGAGGVQRLGGDEGDVVVQPPVITPLAGAGLVAVANQPPWPATATAACTGRIARPPAPARYTPTTRPTTWTLTSATGRQLP